ncbi:proteinase-activated receptor 3 [Ictalurus punctatus]|uniref:Proteinase-activated receptor 3 n=1 Tax=Ictalurus punctatus TaxID=7998 RepID=A0A2D0QSY0_ICTPU|nr:proteinase-activated receptor 3 [Ictalurus punctatus]
MLIMEYTMRNENNGTKISLSNNSFQTNVSSVSWNSLSLGELITQCNSSGISPMRVPIQILVLILALPANAVLLWLLVKKRKTLSPSEVLGLNMAVLSVLFCLSLPLDINISSIQQRSGLSLCIVNAFSSLSYFGCPLLLTSMCLERYVAVAHPVLFISLGKWEYRAACSAIIWFLTCIMAGINFVYSLSRTAVILSIIINVMFIVMVACLLGIVWVLHKKVPGEGDQNNSVVKKRALKNIVAVLVPSTIIYFPLLGLAPFLLIIQTCSQSINMIICTGLLMFSIIPHFGVCIGPMFYIARLRQMLCVRNNESRDTKQTITDQRN